MPLSHEVALSGRSDLTKYGNNSHLLFAIETAYQIEDIHTVAVDALTDGQYDKKCDLIYLNTDEELLVVAQGYVSATPKNEAPANKASDLNTAAAWLFATPLSDIPSQIQSAAYQVHAALKADQIRTIQFWYVHNCRESQHVKEELARVESSVMSAIRLNFPACNVTDFRALEVGQNTLEDWYTSLEAPILVNEQFEFTPSGGFVENGADWQAYVTSLDGSWLYDLYKKHNSRLFSANLRDYLGSRKSSKNINFGIKQTAESDPTRFWVYNNGITALVHDFTLDQVSGRMTISGFSIVNGAQTTGSMGLLTKRPTDVKVQARIVKCADRETIQNIIKYNNSQNPLISPDFRSNDTVQRRLRNEFTGIPGADYAGGRRGMDGARRASNLLPSDTVAQAVSAVHGYPHVAYHEKGKIWLHDNLYVKFFNDETTAEHIVWCYSLLKSIEAKKTELVARESTSNDLPTDDQELLQFMRRRGSTILLTAAIAGCTEIIMNKSIPNLFKVSFGKTVSPGDAENYWHPIVDIAVPFASQHLTDALSRGIDSGDQTRVGIKQFSSMVKSTYRTNKPIIEVFASRIETIV